MVRLGEYIFVLMLLLIPKVLYGKIASAPGVLYVTPEMYGAKGDGKADDTKAIQSAINNSSGVPVIFSPRTYRISQTIRIPANTILTGNRTKFENITPSLLSVISSENSENIIIDGFEISFGASKTMDSKSRMFRDGVITLSGEKGCNNSVIRNCKIYGLNYNQAGIVLKGDHVEISKCEVYSGSGNRRNAGIVCGSYDHGVRTSIKNGGCNYASVHDCYVHDISIGNTPDESGCGIYLLACNYSSVYNCRVDNCNWVCINSQSEECLPGGSHNAIYNNVLTLNSKEVYPPVDYIGPYCIYMERSSETMVFNNVMFCGYVTSKRFIPLQVSGGSSTCIIKDNKFVDAGSQNVYALVGADETVIYEHNECDFAPPTYFFCYDSENPSLEVSYCTLSATEQIINYYRRTISAFKGYLTMRDCIMNAPKFNVNSSKDKLDWYFHNCEFTGNQFLFDYNEGNTYINNCTFKNVQKIAEIRYGSGEKSIRNCRVENGGLSKRSILWHIRGGNYSDIIIEKNEISFEQGVALRVEEGVQVENYDVASNTIKVAKRPKDGLFEILNNKSDKLKINAINSNKVVIQ